MQSRQAVDDRFSSAWLVFARATVAVSLVAWCGQAAEAVPLPINSFAGAYSTMSPISSTVTQFINANGAQILDVPITDAFYGAKADDLKVDVTAFNAAYDTFDDVTLITAGISNRFTVSLLSNIAVFDVSNAKLLQTVIGPPILPQPFGVGYIVADLSLNTSLTSAPFLAELQPFLTGGKLVLSYNGVIVNANGTATLSTSPSSSFSVTAVPEPSCVAMTLSGFGFLTAVGWRLRRRGRLSLGRRRDDLPATLGTENASGTGVWMSPISDSNFDLPINE